MPRLAPGHDLRDLTRVDALFHHRGMDPVTSQTLADLLLLATLTAATCQCAAIVRQRTTQRRAVLDRVAFEEAGLRGLVRVFFADPPGRPSESSYRPE